MFRTSMCARLRTITGGVISNGMWAAIGMKQSNVGELGDAMDDTDDVTKVVIAVLVCAILVLALLVAVMIAIVIKKYLQRREK